MTDPEQPQDVPILDYYTPPKRRRFRITVRHTQALVVAMAGLLLGSLYAAGVWQLAIGPRLPTTVAHRPVGINDDAIAIGIADAISHGEQEGEVYHHLLNYLRGYGMTVLDGPIPSGITQADIRKHFRIHEVRKDSYSLTVWFKLPTGWLAIGPMSIVFWPDKGNWHTETTWKPKGQDFEYPGAITRTIYCLADGMEGEIITSGLGGTTYLGITRNREWQASLTLRIALWASLTLGIIAAIIAMRTRPGGEPRWALQACLAWSLLAAGLCVYAGWAIVPFAEVFQLASSPAVPQYRAFGFLLVPPIAGFLLCAALWLHQRLGRQTP